MSPSLRFTPARHTTPIQPPTMPVPPLLGPQMRPRGFEPMGEWGSIVGADSVKCESELNLALNSDTADNHTIQKKLK